jgi:hypothetical protein
MIKIQEKYNYFCGIPSDINEHLPVLYRYAKECNSVIECGVRNCVSSWALVYGLLNNDNNQPKTILLNDMNECNIEELLNLTKDLPIEINYEWKNDLDLELTINYDMVFIDTWHVYGQLKRELSKFSKCTNKYIIMHDTIIDEIYGETLRLGLDAQKQSEESGYTLDEINCGLNKAVIEFLQNNPDWEIYEKLINNNGLTVLKKME